MSTSQARILANQANAQRSTGPRTPEGKERSRANAFKHGLTGAGIVLPNEDAAEVDRRFAAFEAELKPSGEVGRALVRRAAILSVRMDRGVSQETAALSERVRQAGADFVAPEGLDEAAIDRLRAEAGARAMFDPSREATLARKYEAAAERGFFRALKELRELEKQAVADQPAMDEETFQKTLGSYLSFAKEDAEFDAMCREESPMPPTRASSRFEPANFPPTGGGIDVPFSIGLSR
jgi:hypothetical protein